MATAIYDGADGIMLSAESAAGKFPVESVEMQRRIISAVENDPVRTENTRHDAKRFLFTIDHGDYHILVAVVKAYYLVVATHASDLSNTT